MKSKAAGSLKHILTVLATMAKTKTLDLKKKTRALKSRLVIFFLLQNKKILMTSISQKLNALMVQNEKRSHREEDDLDVDKSEAIVRYNCNSNIMPLPQLVVDDQDERFPNLTHSVFDVSAGGDTGEEIFGDVRGSVIDLVKHSKEDKGEEFRLEDEIDRAADLFIKRFHRQMRLQKQLSLKRHQETICTGKEHLLNI